MFKERAFFDSLYTYLSHFLPHSFLPLLIHSLYHLLFACFKAYFVVSFHFIFYEMWYFHFTHTFASAHTLSFFTVIFKHSSLKKTYTAFHTFAFRQNSCGRGRECGGGVSRSFAFVFDCITQICFDIKLLRKMVITRLRLTECIRTCWQFVCAHITVFK